MDLEPMRPDAHRENGLGEEVPRIALVSALGEGSLQELLKTSYSIQVGFGDRPDLFVVDLPNPHEVVRVVQALASNAKTRGIPILVASGPGAEAGLAKALESGATDFFRKPVHPALLTARIERVLREAREKKRLADLAQIDELTGLANYRALKVRLREEFKRAERYEYGLGAVMMDLDHLKFVNDRWGHEVGNRALLHLAQCLKKNLREMDFAARYGGDEFLVLLPHQTPVEAAIFANRLREDLRALRLEDLRGEDLRAPPLTLSIGIAGHEPGNWQPSPEHLLERADLALYQAKSQGRDQVAVDLGEHALSQRAHGHP